MPKTTDGDGGGGCGGGDPRGGAAGLLRLSARQSLALPRRGI